MPWAAWREASWAARAWAFAGVSTRQARRGQEEGEGRTGLATRLGQTGTRREGLSWAGPDEVKGKVFPFYDLEIIWEGFKRGLKGIQIEELRGKGKGTFPFI